MHFKQMVTIVGSGFAGLGAAYQLKKSGISDFIILERNDEVGGVWYENRYPGLECDIPSHVYSYSFHKNPNWGKIWASGPEILQYLIDFANTFEIRKKIRFNTTAVAAIYNEQDGLWMAKDDAGNTYQSKYIIFCAGKQNSPKIPAIEGLDTFEGEYFHSARWDDDVDLNKKRIGVIGTGTSAIQFIPIIAKVAEHLTVFQRSPIWILPKLNVPYSEKERAQFKRNPKLMTKLRRQLAERSQQFWPCTLNVKNPNSYIPKGFIKNKSEIFIWPCAVTGRNRDAVDVATKYMKSIITEKDLQKKLIPTYPIGAKRIGVCSDYLPTFNQKNVDLVTGVIKKIQASTVIDEHGKKRDLDVMIFATGFHSTQFLSTIGDVKGLYGYDLHRAWQNESNAEAYLGTFVHNFPNMFMLSGPNSSLGSTGSVLQLMEGQFNLICQAIGYIEKKSLKSIMVRKEVQDLHNQMIHDFTKKTVLTADTNSWYKTADNKVTNVWPFLIEDFLDQTKKLKPSDYIVEK